MVGLIYGPSGCGKSSLVKAGLLPRLAGHVTPIHVDATAPDTEARLVKGLRRHCPGFPSDLGLVETLAALRRGRAIPPGGKVLIVLDQFEQSLHAKSNYQNTELVQALRQCDVAKLTSEVSLGDVEMESKMRSNIFRAMAVFSALVFVLCALIDSEGTIVFVVLAGVLLIYAVIGESFNRAIQRGVNSPIPHGLIVVRIACAVIGAIMGDRTKWFGIIQGIIGGAVVGIIFALGGLISDKLRRKK
jgi:uncharacterized membrane protein